MRRGPKAPIHGEDGSVLPPLVTDDEFPDLREPEFVSVILEALVPGEGCMLIPERRDGRATLYRVPRQVVDAFVRLQAKSASSEDVVAVFTGLAADLLEHPQTPAGYKVGGIRTAILELDICALNADKAGPKTEVYYWFWAGR
jgi:hypothetical protein